MKILTWNVRHGGGSRAVQCAERVVELNPDIAIITEFRNNSAGETIQAILTEAGFSHLEHPKAQPRQNSVLVAARYEFNLN